MTTLMENEPTAEAPASKSHYFEWFGRYGALLVLAALIIVTSILAPNTFPTVDNAINILNQSALSAIIAMGLTFVLVTGEFDLSIGNTASLAGVAACWLMVNQDFSIPLALVAILVVGGIVGLINGFVVTFMNVSALVATLGVGTIVIGVNYMISDGAPVALGDPDAFLEITFGRFLGIPYPVYIMLVIAALLWWLLNRTVLGQSMQAVGGNRVAAELSGIRVDRVRVIAFVVCSMCAAVTGFLLASRTGSAAVSAGDTYLLSAFAASFFGSAVLRDGQFHILGTLVGVITVSVGFNSIALIGLETYWQYFFQGLLLILGVGVGTLARRRAAA
ncbi:ABC transporter permease [Aeromicrobium tamlense]|uniref:ABC transporter permease n=1 Tax=Aeromicrobium tamlense TaxID=375541 RepID=A0A8I0FWF3_9ACTN|nr:MULTISPECIES: ABC transporter permease [Aeromicrobium]MBD1269898.1 ABC transporter permease [Aeromicrobium tamlense]NYI39445.1 ribose transport system permease protein [Aeromicrobium tamlense]